MYSFPNFELVFCSMSSSNFCFLTCMQVSQRTVRWSGTSISLRIFQFVVIHTVKSFSIDNEAEVDVFLEFPCFFYDPTNVAIWSMVLLPFLKDVLLFSSIHSLRHVRLFATPWIAALQASLSIINSQSSPKLTCIESVMPSSHLILCHPLLLPPSIFLSIRVFSNESVLRIR